MSSRSRVLWAVFWCFSLLGLADLPGAPIFTADLWLQWVCMGAVASLKATLCLMLVAVCRNKILRCVAWLFVAAYMAACLLNAVSFLLYGFGVSHRLAVVVMQTSGREFMEFMPSFFSNLVSYWMWILGAFAAAAAIALAVRLIPARPFLWLISILSACGLGVTIYFMLSLGRGRSSFFLCVRVPKNIVETHREYERMESMTRMLRPLPDAESVASSRMASVVVMVIGESASRGHLSLYGYPLQTTPVFDSLRDSLFVFSDAIASSTTTAGNMERILSLKVDDATRDDWWRYPLLIDIMNEAGYTTYWLSNQERTGIWGNSSGVMSGNADVVRYVGSESSEDALLDRYDEALLPEVTKALSDTAAFIGVHLMGSHMEYSNRYPASAEYFKGADVIRKLPRPWLCASKAQTVAEYDNSIRYTDAILGRIIDRVSRLSRPALFVYFSDHGENVYDTRDYRGRDNTSVRVPMVVYANSAYRRANPDMVEALGRAVSLPVSTATVAFPLMTLSGTSYSRYRSDYDFLSPDFKVRPRYVDEQVWTPDEISEPKTPGVCSIW